MISTEPPYANVDDIQSLIDKLCVECYTEVAPDTLPSAFCAEFGSSMPGCCETLLVKEGENFWISNDCSNWVALTPYQTYLVEELFYENLSLSGVNTITVPNIPAGEYIKVVFNWKVGAGSGHLHVEFNADAVAANYDAWEQYRDQNPISYGNTQYTATPLFSSSGIFTNFGASDLSTCVGTIYNHSKAFYSRWDARSFATTGGAASDSRFFITGGFWKNIATVNSARFYIFDANNFIAGSQIRLYVAQHRKLYVT
jgi:hypothetical protein